MKQVVQSARRGRLTVEEVPVPALRSGHVLVRNRASLISAGTERLALRFAGQNLLQKAKGRPDLVRKTLAKAKRDGITATVRAVMARLDEPLPMGYSAAGVVEAVGDGLAGRFRIGQRIATAGAGQANHAELNVVPANLAASVPEDVADEEACYATLCAIAMHGIRHTRPELGGWCAVVGVGLVGQLATQLLALAGVRVLALDYDVDRLQLAQRHGAEAICDLGRQDAAAVALAATDNIGCDGVVIAAASDSAEPFETAEQVARDRAIVSLIGNTGTAFAYREFMRKELTVVASRSYGPGRYDVDYETHGAKYPLGFVRWTETENLKAVLDLMRPVRQRRLNPGALTTHSFEFEQAATAYALIESAGEPAMGIVLRYGSHTGDQGSEPAEGNEARAEPSIAQSPPAAQQKPALPPANEVALGHCTLGVIGAGAFARSILLPTLAKLSNCRLHTVVAASGISAQRSRERFGFEQAATDAEAVFANPDVNAVLLATPHSLHAEHAIRALEAQKHVLVEKPLCLTRQELSAIVAAADASAAFFQVGFNRRFAPLALAAEKHLAAQSGPRHVLLRVNAGALAEDSWQREAAQGGGRILGEACHFIDLAAFLGGAPIVSVTAEALRSEGVVEDVTVVVELANGSSATLFYTTHGDPGYSKELVEAYAGGSVVRIEDFRRLTVAGRSRSAPARGLRRRQEKGHRQQLQAFVAAVIAGGPAPVNEAQLLNSSLATLAVRESLAEDRRILLRER